MPHGRTRLAVSLAVLAVSPAAAVFAPPAGAAYPGSKGAIAFSSREAAGSFYGDTNFHLYASNADGTGRVQISSVGEEQSLDLGPRYSPDGNRIVYERCPAQLFGCDAGRTLVIANADGTNAHELTSGVDGSWSPDGSQLVFNDAMGNTNDPSDPRGLYVINADGTNRHLLITPSGGGVGTPSWSPTGAQVAYVDGNANVGGDPSGPGGQPPGIFAVDVAGAVDDPGRKHLLVAHGDPSTGAGLCDQILSALPDWSPDGNKVAYDCYGQETNGDLIQDLAVFDVATHAVTRITNTPYSQETGDGAEQSPNWSPDGTRIVYGRFGGLWVASADGSNQHSITPAGFGPSWQPCVAATTLCGPPPASATNPAPETPPDQIPTEPAPPGSDPTDPPPAGTPQDTPIKPSLFVNTTQRISRSRNYVVVKASCPARCTALRGTGKIRVGSTTVGRLKQVTKASFRKTLVLRLKLGPKVLTKALRALRHGKKTTARFKVTALDSHGRALGARSGTVRLRVKFIR